MSKAPAYQHYPGDILADRRFMSKTPLIRDAVRLIRDEMWLHGSNQCSLLKNDYEDACSYFRISKKAMEAALEFFEVEGDLITCPTLKKRKEELNKKSDTARNAVNKRWYYKGNTDVSTPYKKRDTPCNTLLKEEEEEEVEEEVEVEVEVEKNKEIEGIFSYWNNKKIIEHRKLTEKQKGHIRSKFDDYSLDEIKKAIDNYDYVLKSEKHQLMNYRWTLDEFFSRSNAFLKFLDSSNPMENYKAKSIENRKESPNVAFARRLEGNESSEVIDI